ncbi:5-carboxymethyl-2-hydroxymuconate isomerase [Streptomyces sp. DI166]|uniref:5-carboxymethyl-2-hydroxymuconate Delta-isomerase n=1 Tax=unclassified Streptomyces TaxID=2593676 RepID=UPI0007F3A216|nr:MULTISPECIES: 5-carboxymethyl-2-hydroxymuconate Delta-isomerase [unclassified Streptomyces]SBT92861.1 5-carboxymethyl-2-hydroxymuconate isomerase [Streptomyces sp. DI166]
MPQITVDYSEDLAESFDRPAFARDLHTAVVEIAAAKQPACKTRFRRTETTVVGQEPEGHALIHVHIALLAGRTDETKSRLTEAVLDLLRKHITPPDGRRLHASAEIRDLDPSYAKYETE